MYRGFEQILQGQGPARRAGVRAAHLRHLLGVAVGGGGPCAGRLGGVVMPPNGQHATNLMLATENLADHLTHFYLFFMPDFVRPVYAGAALACRGGAPLRPAGRRAGARRHRRAPALASRCWARWVASGRTRRAVEPGGSTRAIDAAERVRLLAKVREFRSFLERQLFARRWKPWPRSTAKPRCGLACAGAGAGGVGGDFRFFLSLARDLGLEALGPGPGRYLSYGAYPQPGGGWALPGGVWRAGTASTEPLVLRTITEDATHAWLAHARGPLHPLHGLTRPEPDKAGAYTWNKAPRLAGEVVETGAIARQLASGHAAGARRGGNATAARCTPACWPDWSNWRAWCR
jgi:hypothetical protein